MLLTTHKVENVNQNHKQILLGIHLDSYNRNNRGLVQWLSGEILALHMPG